MPLKENVVAGVLVWNLKSIIGSLKKNFTHKFAKKKFKCHLFYSTIIHTNKTVSNFFL